MTISFIDTGLFKLDGGAMFGIVPRSLWQRLNAPDENNLCTWAMRCLLIETAGRRILVDTGIGDKQDARFRSFFHPHGEASLLGSLAAKGLQAEDITDVLLTHLHFDHVGGAVRRDDKGRLVPTFPNATYWTNDRHWQWATDPNPREAASFLPENILPLQEHGVLEFLDVQKDDLPWLPGIRLRYVYGHTEAMMLPIIEQDGRTLAYCADLIPSSFHLGMPYVMAYDVRPLDTLAEKGRLLEEALAGDWVLSFEHDPGTGAGKLVKNEKGRIGLGISAGLAELGW
ncbi:MAG: MBL fold metallo-hydrolase [Lewinella sp.]|nr:MBL fold metallo-hydrolase [Lewinella sp.]